MKQIYICYRYTPETSTTTTLLAPLVPHGTSDSFVASITIRFNAQDDAVRFRFSGLHISTTRADSLPSMITLIQP